MPISMDLIFSTAEKRIKAHQRQRRKKTREQLYGCRAYIRVKDAGIRGRRWVKPTNNTDLRYN